MTALTIDIDGRLIEALRDTAARRHTTVDAIVEERVSDVIGENQREAARAKLKELLSISSARMGPDVVWSREATYAERVFPRHEHPALRGDGQDG